MSKLLTKPFGPFERAWKDRKIMEDVFGEDY